MDHISMLTPIVQVSYFILPCYNFDGLIYLTFLFSIPKCEYICSIIENLLGADDPRGHLAKLRWEHNLNLGQHIDLTKQDRLLPMNLHEAWITQRD